MATNTDHMGFSTLYGIWLDAHNRKALPPEWELFIDFRTWAIENGYYAIQGYEGTFCAESLLAAKARTFVGIDLSKAPDKTAETPIDLDSLKLPDLKELAAKMTIDITGASTKKEIIALIGGDSHAG